MAGVAAEQARVRPRIPRTAATVLALLCAMYAILYVDRVNIATAAPLIQAELRLSNAQLGLAFSGFAYPYAFFQLAGGWLGDRAGPRWTRAVAASSSAPRRR